MDRGLSVAKGLDYSVMTDENDAYDGEQRPVMVEPPRHRVTLLELRPGQCRWPEGDRAPYSFCGAPQVSGSYCGEHHKLSVSSASLRPLNFAPRHWGT